MEGKSGGSASFDYLDEEDEEKQPLPAVKPDARVVNSIYGLVVDKVAKELRTDEHED